MLINNHFGLKITQNMILYNNLRLPQR
jgi:hypothetical protein